MGHLRKVPFLAQRVNNSAKGGAPTQSACRSPETGNRNIPFSPVAMLPWGSGARAPTVIGPNPLVTAGKKGDKHLDTAPATPKYFQRPVAPVARRPVDIWGSARAPPFFLCQVSHQLPGHLDSGPRTIKSLHIS